MKKIIAGLVLVFISTVSYAKSYECTAYTDGSPKGETIKVNASTAAVAETKALSRLRKKGSKADYVKCK